MLADLCSVEIPRLAVSFFFDPQSLHFSMQMSPFEADFRRRNGYVPPVFLEFFLQEVTFETRAGFLKALALQPGSVSDLIFCEISKIRRQIIGGDDVTRGHDH